MRTIWGEVRYVANDLSSLQEVVDEMLYDGHASLLVWLDLEMSTGVLSRWDEVFPSLARQIPSATLPQV